jgi:outer membrane protein assembly factor BamB
MKIKSGWVFAALLSLQVSTSSVLAEDWPQWRGPNRNGISEEKGLLKEWPKDGPKLVWQVKDLGAGYSTPSVVGDQVFVLSNEGLENESVQARSVKDGKQLWAVRLGKVGEPKQQPAYPAARSTPTIDGDLLYAIGSDGDLVCLAKADGKERWRKSLRTDFGGQPGRWAYSESPLIDGDVLVCTPGGKDATIVALNKKNGEVIWKSAVPNADAAAYASATIVNAAGTKQYVQFLPKSLVGVDAKSGKFLWAYGKTAEKSAANIPTPVSSGDFVYSATGQGGAGLVKIAKNGDEFAAEEIYFDRKLPNQIGGVVLLGENLYGTTGTGLECVDFKTGAIKWQDRSIGAGSICLADGQLYLHSETSGEVALVEASPAGYKEKGRFTPREQPERKGKAWAYPVVANGRFYVRDTGTIWCYDVKGKDLSLR